MKSFQRKPRVGETVEIHNAGKPFNGKTAEVVRVDGHEIHVQVELHGIDQTVIIYPCECTIQPISGEVATKDKPGSASSNV